MLKALLRAVLAVLIPAAAAFAADSAALPKTLHFEIKPVVRPGGFRLPVAPPPVRARVGLALAGGGARAAASVGVLKALHKAGIPVTALAGTSMGAIVGGLSAAGYGPDEIERIFLDNDWNDIFTDTPARSFMTQERKETGGRHLLQFSVRGGKFLPPTGLSAGQKLSNLLTAKTLAASFRADMNFDNLPVPFRAVATDIETGAPVVIGTGLLHEALRASSAIPVLFLPIEIDGKSLVDGGLANNLPVDVVRSMNADLVIAVDASARLETKERLGSLAEIMGQAISLSVRRETERQAVRADVVIAPDTASFSFYDFDAMQEIIARGEAAAERALPAIRALLNRPRPKAAAAPRFTITGLTVRGIERTREDDLRAALAPVLAPHDAAEDTVREALAAVTRLGCYSALSLDLTRTGVSYAAVLTVAEHPVIDAIRITDSALIPASEVMDGLTWQLGTVMNTARIAAYLDEYVRQLHARGYLLARVASLGLTDDGRTLSLRMADGTVEDIRLQGKRRTEPVLIRREIGTRVGAPLNFSTLSDDIQHLYGLDFFESINVDIGAGGAGGVVLTIRVKEKPRGSVRVGLRYDLEDSFTGLTDVIVDNLNGQGIKLYLTTRYGNYTDVALGYHSPVFLQTSFVHGIEVFHRERTYNLYQDTGKTGAFTASRTGGDFSFGYEWFKFGDTHIRYRYEAVRTAEVYGAPFAGAAQSIGSLGFLTVIDTRNSQAFPRSGFSVTASYESASESYGGDAEFRKTTLHGQIALPVGEGNALIADVTAGFGSGAIPEYEQFGIGGADYVTGTPLLGYQRREFFGPNQVGWAVAFRRTLEEYKLKAVKALYLNLAVQAANVWAARDAMSLSDLRMGGGVGIHADTIVGPFRLDFGAGEDRRRTVYFSAGFDF